MRNMVAVKTDREINHHVGYAATINAKSLACCHHPPHSNKAHCFFPRIGKLVLPLDFRKNGGLFVGGASGTNVPLTWQRPIFPEFPIYTDFEAQITLD